MKVLIIGNGGREAAIAHEILKSPLLTKLYMVPKNDFYEGSIHTMDVSPDEKMLLLAKINEEKIDLVIIGPELPLVDGLSDFLRSHGVYVFGASKKGAMLEGSKLNCKEYLTQADISTAKYQEVFSYEDCLSKSNSFSAPWILKADGLAAGKGVYICHNRSELEKAAKELFLEKKLGSNMRFFLEENLPGKELSYLILTNGKDFSPLPIAQDHKRIFDHDNGPNTGGMGAVAPLIIDEELREKINSKIIKPFVQKLFLDRIEYKGVVYFGIMAVRDEPYVLEINARFGDPETQVLLPLLDGDWLKVFFLIAQGDPIPTLNWKNLFSAVVVMASPGYPEHVKKGIHIDGNILDSNDKSYFLPAGIKKEKKGFVTNGGRVLNSVGLGHTASDALENSYNHLKKVIWSGLQKRSDIGLKVLHSDKFIF